MRRTVPGAALLIPCFLLFGSRRVGAAELELPRGARWMVAAPSPERFSREFSALSKSAGARSPSLAPRTLGERLQNATGLPLLSSDALSRAGVDPSRPWQLFRRAEVTYLAVVLRDEKAFAAAMQGWAAVRQLKSMEQRRLSGGRGRVVTWARAKGSRAAAGYVLDAERAVVLVDASTVRPHGLESALEAVYSGATIASDLPGSLLLWVDAPPWARDLWLGVTAGGEGLRVAGRARAAEKAQTLADATGADWVGRLLGEGGRSEEGAALALRVMAGESLSRELSRLVLQAAGPADQPGVEALARTVRGTAELRVQRLVPPKKGAEVSLAALLRALTPTLTLPGRAASAPAVERAIARAPEGLRVARQGEALVLSRGGSAPASSWAEGGVGASVLRCERGRPVMALRLDGRAAARSLESVGLWEALGGDLLAALFAVRTEFGPLLAASQPLRLLTCQDGTQLSLSGQWFLQPK